MLIIDDSPNKGISHLPWWLGYPIPTTLGPVIRFQADGHELEMVYEAMRTAHLFKGRVKVGEDKQIPTKKRRVPKK